MGAMASQITSLTIVCSTDYLGADQRKRQSSASVAFVQAIHRSPVNSPAQMASNAENVPIEWRHHVFITVTDLSWKLGVLNGILHLSSKISCNLSYHFYRVLCLE